LRKSNLKSVEFNVEIESQAKDITALLNRAGLSQAKGTYQEFASRESASVDELTPVPTAYQPTFAQVSREMELHEQASVQQVRRVPSLDHLLESITPHKDRTATRATTLAIYSLAGGVGKTTIATAMGRLLSVRNQRVILANLASTFGLLHLRGPYSQTLGSFTFLHTPKHASAFPLTLLDVQASSGSDGNEEALKAIHDASMQANQVLLDLPSDRTPLTLESLRTADHVLIPLCPDMHSAVTLPWLEELLDRDSAPGQQVHYIINRFQASRLSHLEMRDRFQTMLGEALLPFDLREDPEIQDAARSSATIVDYQPQSEVVSNLQALSEWVELLRPRTAFVKGISA
jgi:cellulose biosynthesis protein BcsQ